MESKFELDPKVMSIVTKDSNFKTPMPVQMQAIPILFSLRDAIICAETGSGKSLAFVLPMLKLVKPREGLQSLILAPTRELAIQLYKDFLVYMGTSTRLKVKFLRKALYPKSKEAFNEFVRGTDILISTPLKLS